MVAGHLQIKKGYYYAVLSWNSGEKRKTKWVPLGLPEKGNKRKAQVELSNIRSEFIVPVEEGDLSADMLFADYLLEWLEIAKGVWQSLLTAHTWDLLKALLSRTSVKRS